MKKLNEKSKIEQLFIITLMFVTLMAMFCLTGCGGCFGCGGNSCEKIKCSNEEKISGISIPVDISLILGNLITVIFDYQIPHKPLKILSL